ncbi:MAG: hypothetical protein A2X61_14820 [Ignavibacteria bacterium GWB2_35_12]|nr:MAG: hypothetical protein A2X63_06750 [Ignavibacteria bacterium GWA2_35_8]OGU38354.1 MAG: hypothetical protein A2X61_14820 [Ignavibacteria bacterium GWB2_35_12]OGU94198.1 MAG: hypothetical protein A2220_01695 [Ignavibacteria bacterium RIFOXYA2_FULL_35_10]OGV23410.1 MAG: hypothetical protein A2475_06435 [Ignavibacteria bacterium RIFOXYC2_FULL_35_21]
MSKRTPKLVLEDIFEAAESIITYTEKITYEEFVNDKKTIDAVIRNFEIIGEAVKLLPLVLKNKYTEINWQRIRGFRNRIIHDYFGVDLSIVWTIIETQIMDLKNNINQILSEI